MVDSVMAKEASVDASAIKSQSIVEASDSHQINEIKSILLDREILALDNLQSQLDILSQRVGNPEALTNSVNDILVKALTDTRESDPKGLSRAISPTVIASIQHHMKHSVDDIVEVLYPITGRMVAASVRSSLAKLSDNINEQIETRYSPRGLIANIRARITGKPLSDFLIIKCLFAEIERIMIIEKYSGKIVGVRNSRDPEQNQTSKEDLNLVSGLLTSLSNFAEEVFETTVGGLRTLNLDGRQIALRRSASHLIAIEISGILNSNEEQLVDEVFLDAVTLIDSKDTEGALDRIQKLGSAFENARLVKGTGNSETQKQRKFPSISRVLAVGAVLALAVWIAIGWESKRQLNLDVTQLQTILDTDATTKNFPIDIQANYSTGEIQVTGLLPTGFDITQIENHFKAVTDERSIILSFSRIATGD